MDPMDPRPHSSDLYAALNSEPSDHAGGHRYIHVIGTSVFVDTEVADDTWERHVVGIVEGDAWWAVDVPADAEDPSYGSALDLFSYFGRAAQGEWMAAGRAVQLIDRSGDQRPD